MSQLHALATGKVVLPRMKGRDPYEQKWASSLVETGRGLEKPLCQGGV